MKTKTVVLYKGKKYPLLWRGQTRFGRRAKLGFFNSGKEFWVDASDVTDLPAPPPEDATDKDGRNCPWDSSAPQTAQEAVNSAFGYADEYEYDHSQGIPSEYEV